ncbi:MAG: extracellular solute-binding protein [Caryophanon sp.]|nr:extracellular solute-binding protein [Caryophanon sp.]
MRKWCRVVALFAFVMIVQGCSEKANDSPLDPNNPISITLWHYYSGNTKIKFDQLVETFNETVGMEKGILVDAQSQGDISRLETAVYDAANNQIGAQRLPDIFASYPDNAYRVSNSVEFVDLTHYFSDEELAEYREDFLQIGQLGKEQTLTILPIAKATENVFVNKTVWDAFSRDTNTELSMLRTWEGIAKVSELYYKWSNGHAFFGIDSVANFMLSTAEQQGASIVSYRSGEAEVQLDIEAMYAMWETYYVPMLKGYYAKEGRFSSDDAKLGVVAAYTGSTASAAYFPTEVTLSAERIEPIESIVLPYPTFAQGEPVVTQQGAGMVIVKSDEAHEFAASEFLKWFTDVEQNRAFAAATAYFPVKTEALDETAMLQAVQQEQDFTAPALNSSIATTIDMLKTYRLYGYPAFDNSYELRELLDRHLKEWVKSDFATLAQLTGEAHAKQLEEYTSQAWFERWYASLQQEMEAVTSMPIAGGTQ